MRRNWINTILLLSTAIIDGVGRHLWPLYGIKIFWVSHEIAISLLLYVLVINLQQVPKVIVESLFILSLFEIIDELFNLGSLSSYIRESVVIGIGLWTLWKIRKLIAKKD